MTDMLSEYTHTMLVEAKLAEARAQAAQDTLARSAHASEHRADLVDHKQEIAGHYLWAVKKVPMHGKENAMKKYFWLTLLVFVVAACGAPAPVPTAPPPIPTPTVAPEPMSAPTAAPPQSVDSVTLAYGAPVPVVSLLPLDVAVALDLFKQEGLNVTMSRMPRLTANNRVLFGQVDFAGESFNPSDAQFAAKALRSVVALARLPGGTLVVRSDLKNQFKTVADLKGQRINYGGSPGVFPYILGKVGLQPSDVQWVADGRDVSQIAADMANGVGVAAILAEPYTTALLKSGKAVALVDLPSEADTVQWLGGEYLGGSLVASTDTIRNRPQVVQKMTNALIKALRYIASHSPAQMTALLPEDVTGKDKATFAEALQHSLPTFSPDGMISDAGVQNAIAIYRALGAIKPDQQISAAALYTNDFVKNVHRSPASDRLPIYVRSGAVSPISQMKRGAPRTMRPVYEITPAA
jgi:sulfonate transport system substrate-binding protein